MATPIPIPIPTEGKLDPVKMNADIVDAKIFCISRPYITTIEQAFKISDELSYVAASMGLLKRVHIEKNYSSEIREYLVNRGFKLVKTKTDPTDLHYITFPRKSDPLDISKGIKELVTKYLCTIRCLGESPLPYDVSRLILEKMLTE